MQKEKRCRRPRISPGSKPTFRSGSTVSLSALALARRHRALGITWVLDGLEVHHRGRGRQRLESTATLALSSTQVGGAATTYLAGAITGSLLFGQLTDRFGRKRLFLVTLGLYILATLLTACSWNFLSFATFRFLTGAAIGGEYAAINSAIDELLPAACGGSLTWPSTGAIGSEPRWGFGEHALPRSSLGLAAAGLAPGLRARRGIELGGGVHPALGAGEPEVAPFARPVRRGPLHHRRRGAKGKRASTAPSTAWWER